MGVAVDSRPIALVWVRGAYTALIAEGDPSMRDLFIVRTGHPALVRMIESWADENGYRVPQIRDGRVQL